MNPYKKLVSDYARLLEEGKSYPLGNYTPTPRLDIAYDAPKALFFAPHPDDECIVGALAVRLMREARMNVINVAVTQGSKKERQAERYRELENACHYLGFHVQATGANGLERINPKTREQDRAHWADCVKVIAGIIENNLPRVILFPHEHDWNSTHIGTHFLVMDALKQMPVGFECYLVETEFWGQMTLKEKVKLMLASFMGFFASKKVVEKEVARFEENPRDYLDAFSEEFPSAKRVLIDKRDEHMSQRLRDLSSKFERIVAVVGDGHIEGMSRRLADLKPDIVRLAQLRRAPDLTLKQDGTVYDFSFR